MSCPYCNGEVSIVGGDVIYPHRSDLHAKHFHRCQECGAYVGCHPGTKKPLGRLANAELRSEKMKAHAAFDPLWKTSRMSRSAAYTWLAEKLGIKKEDCHIGMFDESMCRRVVQACMEDKA